MYRPFRLGVGPQSLLDLDVCKYGRCRKHILCDWRTGVRQQRAFVYGRVLRHKPVSTCPLGHFATNVGVYKYLFLFELASKATSVFTLPTDSSPRLSPLVSGFVKAHRCDEKKEHEGRGSAQCLGSSKH